VQEDLPGPERLAIDLPDREVWVTSTRSRTAGANHARVHPEHGDGDHESTSNPLHPVTLADGAPWFR
jgi:hypothetical protein